MSAHDRDTLPPELLAAYTDGELTPAECRRVEAWIAAHPEAQADLEGQCRLARLLEETVPPPPAGEQWADVLARIERDLATPPARSRTWFRRIGAATAVLAAAAVVLLAIALRRPPEAPEEPHTAPTEDPWPVASADDVLILSMDDRDRGTLVVGKPPVNESLVLMGEGNVKVDDVQPDDSGRRGQLVVSKDSRVPMMIMSLGADPEDDP